MEFRDNNILEYSPPSIQGLLPFHLLANNLKKDIYSYVHLHADYGRFRKCMPMEAE